MNIIFAVGIVGAVGIMGFVCLCVRYLIVHSRTGL